MKLLPLAFQDNASTKGSLIPNEVTSKRSRGAVMPRATQSARAEKPGREQPATGALIPNGAAPAAQPSASAEKPKRGRQAIATLKPIRSAPADQPSASGRADGAKDTLNPSGLMPRQRTSRAGHSMAGTQPNCADASPAQANAPVKSNHCSPGPDDIRDDAGHDSDDPHGSSARIRPADTVGGATDPGLAGGNDGAQANWETHSSSSPIVAEIIALYRLRVRWLKAELKLVLQAQAVCRAWTDGDKAEAAKLYHAVAGGSDAHPAVSIALGPFLAAMAPFRAEGAAYDKRLAKLARQLPVWAWAKGVWGLSDVGLAKIVGEAGDVGSYRNPACLWKRLGLAVINGGRQRRVTDAEEALVHGYSPTRRSMVWNIGNGLIGGMGNGVRPAVGEDWQSRTDWTEYQKLYVGRLIYEAERDPENMARPATATGKMSFSKHAHNRAKRYVEKRALRDLWSAWRAADRGQPLCDAQQPHAPVGPYPMAAE